MCPAVADRATREAWDTVAPSYAQMLSDLGFEAPLDRAAFAAFIEMVKHGDDGPVAEVGCGSGRLAAHLHDAGIRVVGLDLAPRMAAAARAAHPNIPFVAADAGALPIRSSTLVGLVAWYSLINVGGDLIPDVFREFARVTRRGALVIVAFQAGEGERVDRTSAYGHTVPLTYYWHRLADMAAGAAAAGFALHATIRREARLSHETTPQGFVLAERL